MTSSSSQQLFQKTILPIMKEVQEKLQQKRIEEIEKNTFSAKGLMVGAAGPDGGMSAMAAHNDSINYVGEWSSKDLEDYRKMVEAELIKRKIKVTPEIIRMMERQMIKDRIPRSAADYILRSLTSTSAICTVLSSARPTSEYDKAIEGQALKKFNPSVGLELFASAFGIGIDVIATWGLGAGSLGMGAAGKWTLTGLLTAVDAHTFVTSMNKEDNIDIEVPEWMKKTCGVKDYTKASSEALKSAADIAANNAAYYLSLIQTCDRTGKEYVRDKYGKQHRFKDAVTKYLQYQLYFEDCLAEMKSRGVEYKASLPASRKPKGNTAPSSPIDTSNYEGQVYSTASQPSTEGTQQTTASGAEQQNVMQPQQGYRTTSAAADGGWSELWKSIGGSSAGDFLKNPGIAIAMIPDVIFGMFSGNSKTMGFNKSTVMPFAALFASLFFKNKLIKLFLLAFGGFNLLAKSGQEIQERNRENRGEVQYRRYEDQELSPRIKNLQISGNGIVMDIDGVPTFTSLPPDVLDAYNKQSLPLNVIANTLLAQYDAANEKVSQKYEEQQENHVTRGIR